MPGQTRLAGRLLLSLILGGLLLSPPTMGVELSEHGNPIVWVQVGKVSVKAEVVKTPEKCFLGLSGRPALSEGEGMLFVVPRGVQQFCMRDMRFPLDFIWIADGKVAGLAREVPLDFPGVVSSPVPVDRVLEVPGGFCDRYGIKAGDPASWQELP